jgi:Holliday junction resolvasome RuvABC endonuclease subunit
VTTILGIDASSVTIGYALLVDGAIERYGHYDLSSKADIAHRCELARLWTIGALATYQPTLTLIESPVGRHAKAVIPQARVSGAILSALDAAQGLYAEVTPDQGVIALCGALPKRDPTLTKAQNRFARKAATVSAAADALNMSNYVKTVRGKVCIVAANGKPILTEDEADAIGIALHGLTVRVKVAA